MALSQYIIVTPRVIYSYPARVDQREVYCVAVRKIVELHNRAKLRWLSRTMDIDVSL